MQSVLGLGWGSPPAPSVGEWDNAGDGPREGRHFPRDGHDDVIAVLAARGQLAVPLAQAHLGLPPDRLHLGRQLLQPELEMATDLRRVAIGPRPFHQGPPGMGVPGLGDPALPAPRSRRLPAA